MRYQFITVDLFPSNKAAQEAFDGVSAERHAALSDLYALNVQPVGKLPRIVKALGFLAPWLSRMLGTASEREIAGFAEVANPKKRLCTGDHRGVERA